MSIYKECDIRGIYPSEFNDQDTYEIGRAIGTILTGRTIILGGDVRLSTPVLSDRLIAGLRNSGTNIKYIGTVPTPVFYFAIKHLAADGGVMVTASHNPAEYNGFKMMFGDTPVTPEIMNHIKKLVEAGKFSNGDGNYEVVDTTPDYIEKTLGFFKPGKLKVVLDCGNGSASQLAPHIFRLLGHEVIPLYCEFDGSFPNRDPNPAVYEHLTDLMSKVIETSADFGVAFDGDGDRVVFADDMGRVINSERSFVLFIKDYLKDVPSSVVYDIKSSSVVRDAILKMKGKPIFERSGHAFIKKTFLDNQSALAGEISGHFFFGELGYDDGIYAALRMAQILGRGSKRFSEIVDGIPKTLITPDIRVACSYNERDRYIERVYEAGRKYDISLIDGIRVEFSYGWLLVRKSVTEECITIRIEANDAGSMQKIKAWITKVLPEISSVKALDPHEDIN